MKKSIIALLFLGLLITSCSSDDSGSNTSGTDYLPLAPGNYWNYNVVENGVMQRDSLFVANDTVIGGKTYKKMQTFAIPVGFFSRSLDDNAVRKVNSSLVVKGNAGLDLGGVLPIDLTLNDFIIFKENATANQQLSSISGTINQDLEGYPLVIDYTLKSTAGESIADYTSPLGIQYSNVKGVHVVLTLKISTTITFAGFDVPVVLLDTQDVVTSDQYYASYTGMVYATTTTSYALEDFSGFGINLPIPQSGSVVQQEFLDTYEVSLPD